MQNLRHFSQIIRWALAALLVSAAALFAAQPAYAADADDNGYLYTVRIYSGAQGSFNGSDFIEMTVKPGSRVSFSQGDISLNDNSKYYVRGIREAGRDNDTTLAQASFEVEGDADYVVTYGILGDNVAYTVRYVDAAGNELAPTESFYGNVGDSPVLAYRYVEGYQPQAYNLTGTLLPDASQNVYTFVYEPTATEAPAPEPEPETPATPVTPAVVTPTPTPAVATPAPEAAPGTTVAEPPAPEQAITDDPNALADRPAEIQSIRDDENPLASGQTPVLPGDEEAFSLDMSQAALIGVGLAALLLIISFVVFMLARKRRREAEEALVASASAAQVSATQANMQPLTWEDHGQQ